MRRVRFLLILMLAALGTACATAGAQTFVHAARVDLNAQDPATREARFERARSRLGTTTLGQLVDGLHALDWSDPASEDQALRLLETAAPDIWITPEQGAALVGLLKTPDSQQEAVALLESRVCMPDEPKSDACRALRRAASDASLAGAVVGAVNRCNRADGSCKFR